MKQESKKLQDAELFFLKEYTECIQKGSTMQYQEIIDKLNYEIENQLKGENKEKSSDCLGDITRRLKEKYQLTTQEMVGILKKRIKKHESIYQHYKNHETFETM